MWRSGVTVCPNSLWGNLGGGNESLDVLDISSIRAPIGGVYKVKVRLEAFSTFPEGAIKISCGMLIIRPPAICDCVRCCIVCRHGVCCIV
jgi:hypothetical protein